MLQNESTATHPPPDNMKLLLATDDANLLLSSLPPPQSESGETPVFQISRLAHQASTSSEKHAIAAPNT